MTTIDALPGLEDVADLAGGSGEAVDRGGESSATRGGEPSPLRRGESSAPPRLRRPDRRQVTMEPCCLEERLPAGHPARTVWAVVERLDLSRFHEGILARGSSPGRAATDPRLLVALWLYAAIDGVGNGRELDRLCREHDAYRWLCGGVTLNDHTLNDFRVGHESALDELLTQVLATLMHHQVVQVRRLSQDGLRVRGSAGSSSFHREATLRRHLEAARSHVLALKHQAEESPGASARQCAARQRAARERQERLEAALAELPKIAAAKAAQKAKPSKERPPRASSTDPEVRVMKMGDGGFRPAHNVQLATDPVSRAIVGVAVCNAGSDARESEPMRRQVERRTGARVEEHLMDGGFVALKGITAAAASGVTVYAPPPVPRKGGNPYVARKGDSVAVAAWRQRMGTPQAKAVYKLRAATSETVNADLRAHRGLDRVHVRGSAKVRSVILWLVLGYNLMHFAGVWLSAGT